MLKQFFQLIVLLLVSKLSFSQRDSLNSYPSLILFVNGSISIVGGWQPHEGQFYQLDGNDGSKPNRNSIGYGYGLNIAKRIGNKYYISSGVDISNFKYDKFRTTPAKGSGYYPILSDTFYFGYNIKSFRIPAYLHIPLLARRAFIAARIGISNEFNYSEYYYTSYRDASNGNNSPMHRRSESSVTRYAGTKLNAGCDLSFRNTEGRILLYWGADYISPTLISGMKARYFLEYGSVISLRMGFGYFFGLKKKPVQVKVT